MPMVDARLPDGSRVNAIIPLFFSWSVITIRKFAQDPLTIYDLIRFNFDATNGYILEACVKDA